MKKITLLLITCLLTGLANAQIRVTDFNESDLKGNVKQVVEYHFYSSDNANVDTANYDERDIINFDSAGNRINEIFFHKKFGGTIVFTFEHTDSTVTRNQFNNGKLAVKYIYKYNQQGKETEFDTDVISIGALASSTVKSYYTYDNNGNRIEAKQYHEKDLESDDTYTNNDKGQPTLMNSEKVGFSKGGKTIFKYDTNGKLVKVIIYNLNGKKINDIDISYSFIDKNENWLMKESSQYFNNNKKNIILRVITYY